MFEITRDELKFLAAVPPFLLIAYAKSRFVEAVEKTDTASYDDNGITGPDWGHSEVVFKCFCSKMLPAPDTNPCPGISLWKVPHSTRFV